MSNKNLLNEGQVRQFMKLARLEPLTPGFVHGLTERGSKAGDEGSVAGGKKDDTDYSGEGERKGDESKTHAGKDLEEGTEEELDETHGRGMNDPGYGQDNSSPGRRVKVSEGEAGPGELEDFAADDLADDSLEGDEEALGDEEEIAAEEPAEDEGGGRMVSVKDFLAALEQALESAMGDEVEVDASEMEDEVPVEDDFAPEGEEVVADVEIEDEMMEEGDEELEEGVFGGGREKKWDRIAKGLDPSSDPAPHGEEEEATAAAFKAQRGTETADQQAKMRAKRRPRRDHSAMAGSWKPVVEGNTDELVEQITKRVAARILKTALAKK